MGFLVPFLASIPTVGHVDIFSTLLGSVALSPLISRLNVFSLILIRGRAVGIVHFRRIGILFIIWLLGFCSEFNSRNAVIINGFVFSNRLLFDAEFFLHGVQRNFPNFLDAFFRRLILIQILL